MSTEELTKYERTVLANALEEAADDIVEYGWKSEGAFDDNENDPYGTYPRCIWIAASRSLDRTTMSHDQRYFDAMEKAVLEAAEVPHLWELFDKNDSFTDPQEGQTWAYGTLITASHILNPVPVDGEKEMVFRSTKTDTGSTPNAGNRLLLFLKKFIWVR